jgi:hypothetical protein
MIDTITISYRITKAEYNFLFKVFNDLSKQISDKKLFKDRNDRNAYVTYALKELGYPEIKLRRSNEWFDYRAIEIKIRPKLIIEKENYYELIYPNEIERFREGFNDFIGKFNLPDLLYWNVKRIDYAIDLNIPQELITIYMLLFKKANIPYYVLANNIAQKHMDSTTNLYLYSKSLTINYYDRYQTLVNKQLENHKNWKDFNVVKNKLRLEVQCKNCKGQQLIQYLNIENYKKAIETNYDLIIGCGDYYLLNESLNIINKNTKSIRKSIILKDFLKLVHSSGGVWKAKEKFIQRYSNSGREKALKQFSSILNKVRGLGINPVSLSDEYGLVELQNIKSQINGRISEQVRELENLNYNEVI